MLNITLREFDSIRENFEKEENRAPFFSMSTELLKRGLKNEAFVLLLATWNFASFRYVVNKFDLEKFGQSVEYFTSIISDVEDVRFVDNAFLTMPESTFAKIAEAFDVLQEYKVNNDGKENPVIGLTGASKLMHLLYPDFFIIRDGYIRGEKPKELYSKVEPKLLKSGWILRRYRRNGEGYVSFLKQMKRDFSHLVPDYAAEHPDKPFTKAIDEVNYMGITKALQDAEKEKRGRKNEKGKSPMRY